MDKHEARQKRIQDLYEVVAKRSNVRLIDQIQKIAKQLFPTYTRATQQAYSEIVWDMLHQRDVQVTPHLGFDNSEGKS